MEPKQHNTHSVLAAYILCANKYAYGEWKCCKRHRVRNEIHLYAFFWLPSNVNMTLNETESNECGSQYTSRKSTTVYWWRRTTNDDDGDDEDFYLLPRTRTHNVMCECGGNQVGCITGIIIIISINTILYHNSSVSGAATETVKQEAMDVWVDRYSCWLLLVVPSKCVSQKMTKKKKKKKENKKTRETETDRMTTRWYYI